MSGSGIKTVVINTQERALSVDINRLQALSQASYMQILRDWLIGEGIISTGSPLRAEVLSGLYAKPVNASFQLQVAAGSMLCVETPATPDDDPLHLAVQATDFNDPSLVVTPNVSGFARIDLLECQRTEVVLETDSRDIFNDTTGLFTAATVTKVKGSGMTFRVRAGVPAGGVPAPDLGWLPLTAILVPNGALSLNTCTLWDIRPLVTDLDFADPVASTPRHIHSAIGAANDLNVDGVRSIQGDASWVVNGRVVGGVLQSTAPGTLKQYVTTSDASPGLAPANSALVFGYLCFPGGYPRWSRYTDSGTRVPTNFRGIFTLSSIPCDQLYRPTGTISLPASTGITVPAATTEAVALFCVPWDTNAPAGPKAFELAGGRISFADPEGTTPYTATVKVEAAALGINTSLTLNTHYPAPVKGIGVHIYKKWDTNDAFFLPRDTARGKRHDMSLNYGFGASFSASSVGWLYFGERCFSISYNLSAIGADRKADVTCVGTIPMLTVPNNVAPIPSVVVYVPTDSNEFIPMDLGTIVSYGATNVFPLTRITVSGWQWV